MISAGNKKQQRSAGQMIKNLFINDRRLRIIWLIPLLIAIYMLLRVVVYELSLPRSIFQVLNGICILLVISYPLWLSLTMLTFYTVSSLAAIILFNPQVVLKDAITSVVVTYVIIAAIIVFLFIQIKKRKEKERLADEANKTKTVFLANMSHEIRTPLTGIIGFTHILQDKVTDDYQKKLVSIINDSGQQLLRIVNDLLDFSSLQSQKIQPAWVNVELKPFITSITEHHRLEAHKKNLGFHLEIDSQLPRQFMTDPTRLQQILNNLLNNAIKFTTDGSVAVTVKYIDGLILKVQDTGQGIPERALPHIFEQFYQLDSSYRKQNQGKGLGLSITKQLVELLNGNITVISTYGMGSQFTVYLPPHTQD